MNKWRQCFFLLLLIVLPFAGVLHAQESVPVQCGSIVEGELVESGSNPQDYAIELSAGDTLNVRVEPVGQTLDLALVIKSPTGEYVSWADPKGNRVNRYNDFQWSLTGDGGTEDGTTPVLSARGVYTIRILGVSDNDIGVYTLDIGCTLRDGTQILPGDNMPPSTPTLPTIAPTLSPSNPTFFGFPGLDAKDFSVYTFPDLPVTTPFKDQVLPDDQRIHGYSFDVNGNDTLDLTVTRTSGNLNLGLVVLSPDNKVVFQASLVTSESLTTRFTLPTAGTYTIGVFRIDLLPPDSPQPTAFQVQATLNP